MDKKGWASRRVRRQVGRAIVFVSAMSGFWFLSQGRSFDSNLAIGGVLLGLAVMDIRGGNGIVVTSAAEAKSSTPRILGLRAWVVAVVLSVLTAASLIAMDVDQDVFGGRWVWPLYVFVASVLLASGAWAYVFMKKGGWLP